MPQFCGMFAAMTNPNPTSTSFKPGQPRPAGSGRKSGKLGKRTELINEAMVRSFVILLHTLEHFPKRLNRGIPLRERIGFKVRAGMEASMDGETVFGGSACARCWDGTGWRYHPGNGGATWSEYQLCGALP
jgi:hypothetical protein